MLKTLREVCDTLHITRRIVQEYERTGLVSPSERTPNGYLLYDEATIQRIRTIRLYQNIRFSIREIKAIIDAPTDIVIPVLRNKLEFFQETIEYAKKVLKQGYDFLEHLELLHISPHD